MQLRLNIFILKLRIFYSTKNCRKTFFCNKAKTKASLENRGHPFLYIEEKFAKTKFHTNLIGFLTVGVIRSLEGIARLDTIRELFS